MENEKRRKLLVPVFDHLYNLYDHELDHYIYIWENVLEKHGPEFQDVNEKLKMLYDEKNNRNQKDT